MKKPSKKVIDLFEEMYQLTRPFCGECRVALSCCDALYCAQAEENLGEYGIVLEHTDHPTLPFMGKDGCIVPPFARPLCTFHVCDMNAFGFLRTKDRKVDVQATDRYFEIRDKIEKITRREN
jgi:hypothetical protein